MYGEFNNNIEIKYITIGPYIYIYMVYSIHAI